MIGCIDEKHSQFLGCGGSSTVKKANLDRDLRTNEQTLVRKTDLDNVWEVFTDGSQSADWWDQGSLGSKDGNQVENCDISKPMFSIQVR
uniref:RNase H domain-containing protein n=1 Tax=Panagrellus redivivus TaxID=6233 RepID=A0A7E4V9X5_PANRE